MPPLSTQIVGSYVKPAWLVRHGHEHHHDGSWWRPGAEVLAEAQDDAALLAIREQERAGLDVATDGEIRRQHYDRHFAQGLSGVSLERLETAAFTTELTTNTRAEGLDDLWRAFQLAPTITGPIGWASSPAVAELRFLKAHTDRQAKACIVGPMTLYDRLKDLHYARPEDAIMDLAAALNRELKALEAEGCAILSVAEPALHFKISRSREIGEATLARLVEGLTTPVVVHVCYGYAKYAAAKDESPHYPEVVRLLARSPVQAMSLEYEQPGHGPDLLRHAGDKEVHLGLLDLGTHAVETPAHVAARLREALQVIPPERLHPCSDCGMWFLPRAVARAKIEALVAGTNLVRAELGLPIPEHARRLAPPPAAQPVSA